MRRQGAPALGGLSNDAATGTDTASGIGTESELKPTGYDVLVPSKTQSTAA